MVSEPGRLREVDLAIAGRDAEDWCRWPGRRLLGRLKGCTPAAFYASPGGFRYEVVTCRAGAPGGAVGVGLRPADRMRRRRGRRHPAADGGVSRRDVLRAAPPRPSRRPFPGRCGIRPAAAAAGRDRRVVIIGSGIAGLGCAFRLWTSARHPQRGLRVQPGPAGRPHPHAPRLLRRRPVHRAARRVHLQRAHRHAAARRPARPHPGQRQRLPAAHPPRRLRFRFGGRFWPQAALEPRVARVGLAAVPRRRLPQGALADPVRQAHPLGRRWDHSPRPSGSSSTSPAASAGTSAGCAWPCCWTSTAARSPSSPR